MPRKDCLYSRLFGEAFVQNRTLPKAPFDRHAQNTPIVKKTRQKNRRMIRTRERTCAGMWRGSPMANQGDGNICSPSKPSSIKGCEHLRPSMGPDSSFDYHYLQTTSLEHERYRKHGSPCFTRLRAEFAIDTNFCFPVVL